MKRRIEPQPKYGDEKVYECAFGNEGTWGFTEKDSGLIDFHHIPENMPDAEPVKISGTWFWIDDQPEPQVMADESRLSGSVAPFDTSKYPEYGCPFDEPIYAEPSPEPVEKAEIELERLKQRVAKLKTAIRDMIHIGREALK